jgi:shikimate dehydrogenase
MHQAAFEALGLPGSYALWPVPPEPPERIGEAVRGLRALGLRGANVTVPYKRAVLPHLDGLSETARRVGAVNTIVVEDGRLLGENTDAPGLVAHLREEGVQLAGRAALVLGAGGAARAAVVGLAEAGCARIRVLNRTLARAESLVADLGPGLAADLTAGAFPDGLAAAAEQAELIVHCTSLGLGSQALAWDPDVALRPDHVVYDLVYTPRPTALLALAAAAGATALDGLGMLLHQGALSFTHWTGRAAPLDVMRRALDQRHQGLPAC